LIPRVETDRLVLRAFENRDLDAYASFTADPEVMRYMGRGPFDREEAWREIAFFLGHWRLRGFGHWALELKQTGELVGRCGPYFPEGWPALEVGWLLGREHWGKGYATEAARAVIDHAFGDLGYDALVGGARVSNPASRRVLEKCAFQWTGVGLYRIRALASSAPVDRFRLDRRLWASLKNWGKVSRVV
jgi:RimJ/RimL family protein N-acetyltransferase